MTSRRGIAYFFRESSANGSRSRKTLLALVCALALPLFGLEILQAGTIFTVNSTADLPDADPLDGVAQTTNGLCTLRAAVMQANYSGGGTIILPAGTYTITRVHYDDNAIAGDLDISADTVIQGAGSGVTILDGNGSVTHDRVFQVLSTVQNLTLSGMTIRNGESISTNDSPGGGGLYIEGAAHVLLSDVIFENNTGQNGGGVYANFTSTGGSIEMDNVIVRSNSAAWGGVGEGGAVRVYMPSSQSQFILKDSQIYGNTADGTGGGLFVDGSAGIQWTIQHCEIYSNTAASGGGIGNFVPLALSDSYLHNNSVTFDGGAMEAFSPIVMSRTTLNANSAARFGGGIFSLQDGANPAYSDFCHIEDSTLSGNFATYGGAIYHDGFITPTSRLHIINSTVTGNAVSKNGDGGGIYIYGGRTELLNATVAYNRVQLGLFPLGIGKGAGLFIHAGAGDTNITFFAQNSLIANNARGNGVMLDTPDDGFTTHDGTNSAAVLGELAFDLIRTTTNFFISGPQGGNIFGQDPLLGPLQDNGGPTMTHALMPGSPAINAANANAPTLDQRNFVRFDAPDIGAFEFGGKAIRITSIARLTNGQVVLQGVGVPFATHHVQASPALGSSSFTTIGPVTADGTGTLQYNDAGAVGLTRRFYQLTYP
jgi:CSLREA domain-containing protein